MGPSSCSHFRQISQKVDDSAKEWPTLSLSHLCFCTKINCNIIAPESPLFPHHPHKYRPYASQYYTAKASEVEIILRIDKEKMVAGSMTQEYESPVDAKRLWNAFVKDGHNLLPKQVPEVFKSITILEGDGGVGTIRQIDFTPVNTDFSYVKERVDEIDEEKLVYRYSHVEGGMLGKKLASASYEYKYTPKAGGGSVVSSVFHYDSLPGVPDDHEKVKEIKEKGTAFFKKIEAYLLANPTTYC